MAQRKALGRGLSALLGGEEPSTTTAVKNQIIEIPIDRIRPGGDQTRTVFDKDALEEMAASIKRLGVVNPIVVHEASGFYELIAGERRWRASKELGHKTIRAMVENRSDEDRLLIAIATNVHNEKLTPVEEAQSYELLARRLGCTHEEVAQKIGKSRSHVTNMLRVLKLPDSIRRHINSGKVNLGQAKVLAGLDDREQEKMLKRILEGGLSVREVEKSAPSKKKVPRGTSGRGATEDLAHLEKKLRDHLQTKVAIRGSRGGKGRIEIDYYSDENLGRILKKMGLS
ncbi:MAG: ParB/RepB/Spo0J family partition protein [Spirochaetes bacterium]|nr:ParB/RepB/Spo0J family partition protein [Spirochaetota bacterium]